MPIELLLTTTSTMISSWGDVGRTHDEGRLLLSFPRQTDSWYVGEILPLNRNSQELVFQWRYKFSHSTDDTGTQFPFSLH